MYRKYRPNSRTPLFKTSISDLVGSARFWNKSSFTNKFHLLNYKPSNQLSMRIQYPLYCSVHQDIVHFHDSVRSESVQAFL